MNMKLDSLSLDELKKLARDVEKAIVSFEERRRKEALKAIEDVAKKFGMSVNEVVGSKKPSKPRKSGSPAKYKNPDDPSQTWSGRGRQPGWYKDAIAKGKKDSDLLI